ncbi:MAG: hypothetical protein JRD49_04560 [Deltaproteobacteria bacterium]|nr:hypothetical protein [Deltaproteobacteria bacterium]MBW2633115.1 hypothetical protein [Deltaproteobacteria bacterium]MBW2676818.1 hypothetical protein [Deltaproteobacteria bacterium]
MQKPTVTHFGLTFFVIGTILFIFSMSAVSAQGQDFKVLNGDWVRSDGGYSIQVRNVSQDGSVSVAYFNPNRIHVAEANVSLWKGMVKLFIKLQDKGYPGSSYTLYYFETKNALVGFYHQAEMGQTFEVVFIRNHQ